VLLANSCMWLLFFATPFVLLIIWLLYSNSSVRYEQVGGNYAAAILPAQIAAQKHGCAQVLYMSLPLRCPAAVYIPCGGAAHSAVEPYRY
jgi:hypothetical protein